MAALRIRFSAGAAGAWRIVGQRAVIGEDLPTAARLAMHEGEARPEAVWALQGVVSYPRYTTAAELARLTPASPPLGRPEAGCAAMIAITKSDAWWALAQDTRRAIFEEQSGHIAKSMPYLPAVARRLHHARDLGEPFDFVTWFEFAAADAPRFEELLGVLRSSPEWAWITREIDVRLERGG